MGNATIFRRLVVAVVALSVVIGMAAPVGASSGTIEFEEALDEGEKSTQLTVTFTAPQDGTITDADEVTSGDVTFEFDDSLPLSVEEDESYTVSYTATATDDAAETTHSEYVELTYDDGTTAASETLEVTVEELSPYFSSAHANDVEVVFEDDSTQTETVSVTLQNDGDGVMIPDSVDTSSDSEISVDADLPSEVPAGSSRDLELDVSVDSDAAPGTYTVTGTVEDDLGNTQNFAFDVEVIRPSVAGVSGDTVDIGDVLVGDDRTVGFTIDERGGYTGLSGVSASGGADPSGSIYFSGLSSVSTSAGGSDTAEVTIVADSDASQHETLQFTVDLTGSDPESPDTPTTFEARVIYPAMLGDVDAPIDTFEFDEPRTVSAQRTETTVEFDNDGDLEMDVQSVDASVSGTGIDANVVSASNTVGGQDTGEATVEILGDPNLPEDTYTLSVTVQTDDAGTETIQQEFQIEHGTEMAVGESDVNFGEVTITEQRTRSIDVGEALGYNDLSNVKIEQVDGPDEWLVITEEPPASVSAGETAPLVYELQFDTGAEAYVQYTWEFEVSASGVGTETVEVTATARLLSPEEIISDLDRQAQAGGWQTTVSGETSRTLQSMEARMRDGDDFSDGDIQRTLTIGQSTIVLVDSIEAAERLQAEGDYESAQREVVSALIAQNTVEEYAAGIDDEEASASLTNAVESSAGPAESVVDEQRSHYETVLADDDATALERYYASDNLAELARHSGDDQAADDHEAVAQASFDEYQELVTAGVEHRGNAREAHRAFTADATMTVLGQPIVLNPARIDEVRSHSASVSDDLRAAENAFTDAGATGEAAAVQQTRDGVETELAIAEYTLYGVTVVFGVLFVLGVLKEVLNARTFIQESHEATAGDFLL